MRALCAAVLVLLPTTALAQGNPGPFGGLFGREPERVGREYTVFDIRTSIAGESHDRVLDRQLPAEEREISGQVLGGRAGATFARRSDRMFATVRSFAMQHEYPAQKVGATGIDSAATLSAKLTTRFSIDADVRHQYSPYFNFLTYPVFGPELDGVITITAQPYATLLTANSFDGSLGFTSLYAKHSSLSLSASRRSTQFVQSELNDFDANGFRGVWRRGMTRSTALRVEYERASVRFSGRTETVLQERINAGLDFTRPLSLGRRTTMSFDTQTLIVKEPELGRRYRLNGGVVINRWFGKTWALAAQARRTTDVRPGFLDAVNSELGGLNLSGMLAKRVELIGLIQAGRGIFGFDADAPRFTTGNAAAQLNIALTRHFAVFVSQTFDYYEIPPAASVVAPVTQYARNIFTVGISTWIPVFMRERNPSDTR